MSLSRSPDEDALFLRYARSGAREDRNELVERYRGLVVSIAQRYGRHGQLDDLIQVGMIGLVLAVDRFDPSRDTRFTTFATPTIAGEIRRHFRDKTWGVHVPRSVRDLHGPVRATVDDLHGRLGRTATPDEVAVELGITVEHVLEALDAGNAYRVGSLNPPSEDGRGFEIVDDDGDREAELDIADAVRRSLRVLDDRDREIVRLRFYQELTQRQIAERLSCSQMHVSRLLARIYARLGASPELAQLREER